MVKVLFATKNTGKYVEFATTFRKFYPQASVISLADLGYQIPEHIETGTTFAQNALSKAQHAKLHLHEDDKNLIVVADDSGIEIEALGGEPGVFTRRWNGHEMSDQEIIDYCLKKLRDETDRGAIYVTCFAIILPSGPERIIFGKNHGIILTKPNVKSRLKGMPFRELFFVPELHMMFHEVRELPESQRNGYQLGHEIAVSECADLIGRQSAPLITIAPTNG
ncbi:MAG: non-canonical purine NTP pyrophosphatase [Candidatus Saccharibacteria bacterium]|nr:non-canonical purine NTP pyrophosphatase [Candidatus Saccharibacteria bacterium]